MEELVQIHLFLIRKGSNTALCGPEYLVKFYDKDLLKDDFLGSSSLDDNGHAIISISRSDYRSKDSPLEKYPDIYFELYKNKELIYKSIVFKNLHLEEARDFPLSSAKNCNLGTFIIEDE